MVAALGALLGIACCCVLAYCGGVWVLDFVSALVYIDLFLCGLVGLLVFLAICCFGCGFRFLVVMLWFGRCGSFVALALLIGLFCFVDWICGLVLLGF